MKKLLPLIVFSLCLAGQRIVFADSQQNPLAPLNINLKQRQPNWRVEMGDAYPQGSPKKVLYYEPTLEGEVLVKQVSFYQNGQIQSEMDLVSVDAETPGGKEWDSTHVPHGFRIDLTENGALFQVSQYNQGILNGVVQTFFPDGKLQTSLIFKDGKVNGQAQSFYESGQVKEEAYYDNGVAQGEVIQYFENGNKSIVFPHQDGKIHGTVNEWYPNGNLKAQRQFASGVPHGNGRTPAAILYDEQRNVSEVIDFLEGQIVGTHIFYHKNGKEARRTPYKHGQCHGKEQFFAEDGILLGEGNFVEGKAIGRHWRNHPDGGVAYLAEFDSEGVLQSPIVEFNEQGQKTREYFLVDGKLEGLFREWYPDGGLQFEFNYAAGQYEGEQKEYYPTGQIKLLTHYKNLKRDGLHEEWHENGVLARRGQFIEGLRDGQMGEWYPNGNPKFDSYVQMEKPDGIQSEWYENGALKSRTQFAAGLREGWQREWNEKGEQIAEAFYEKDQLQGTVLTWWGQDVLRTRFSFKEGKKTGEHKWYHENGTLARIAHFIDDMADGELKAWYPDGALQLVQTYKQGKLVGDHREYYPKSNSEETEDARLCKSFSYDDLGNLHGEEKTYYLGGKLQAIISYQHGQLNGSKRLWDEQGILLEEANYVQGKLEGRHFQRLPDLREIVIHYSQSLKQGLHEIYYPPNSTGKKIVALQAYFDKDQLHGPLTEFSEQGDKMAQTPYVRGVKEGIASIYSPDRKLAATIIFVENQKHGLMTQYFPSGNVFRETPYVADKREGEEKTFFEDGMLSAICTYENDVLHGLSQSWNAEGVLVFEAEYSEGMRHGRFHKFYDDGSPYLQQTFVYDQLDGAKYKYERDGEMTVSYYEDGKLVDSMY